jgi:hypothetical protein
MDDLGPRLRHLTKPAQLDKKRFELEWVLSLEPELATHVRLFDMECFPPHPLAAGEGADEADALLALWTMLTGQHERQMRSRSWPRRTSALDTSRSSSKADRLVRAASRSHRAGAACPQSTTRASLLLAPLHP